MDVTPYSFCLLLGSSGLALMAALGQLHQHGAKDVAGRGIDHQLGGGAANAHHGDSLGSALAKSTAPHASVLWSLLSPRAILTMLVGAGAAGTVARQLVAEPGPVLSALGGALLFELGVVGPLSRVLLRFASHPARTLETALFDHAVASSRFDAKGHGLVAIELDGHVVQLLGTLTEEERAQGVRVNAGDELVVEAVDPELNRCTVSRS